MKQQADKKRGDTQLEVGDLALVKLQPHRQQFVALRKHQKLRLKFFLPFQVIQKIGLVAYKMKLLEAGKIHHVFHILLLISSKIILYYNMYLCLSLHQNLVLQFSYGKY
ncbi:hypothetical protein V8G54_035740 [Vigna mungo]|uniref:Tf2-1-like SH3-like domain-containing protein n=1 Tax=Vigna mungo TaxID=3915 RepID=A0AAQ3MFG8_VIGMU